MANQELGKLALWFDRNEMFLNFSKSKAITFDKSPNRSLSGNENHVHFKGTRIKMRDKLLGVEFNQKITWGHTLQSFLASLAALLRYYIDHDTY